MVALTTPRIPPEKAGATSTAPVAAGVLIHGGAITVMEAGLAVPGKTAAGLIVLGIADATADNSGGANGALSVTTRRGTFAFQTLATDAVLPADIGKPCFLVDDQTVARTSAGNTRSEAGTVIDVDAQGVWVRLGF
ncbi:hypothetical protein AZC_2148 [Azorhizobium caulinodans ORS 571]|uniref:Bacteriophage lambda head decoration protein D n=1 Tax=Azorhizobium caulinodans (strain ATCC 43989 / DSM 5975 / JCM 20966 / LMG 6465 / NBRC 14845 / NCIMB 13405 / ORS 571) TaxID=438753 RepID=A8I7Q3_AZOC5|nr:hypothetical protein [Azorhizobium caulinodans]BAF88146.1 hypothetical protein AZC_2148 [Azorhizobium caulinodans ORS 571]